MDGTEGVQVVGLKCEYEAEPFGIDVLNPRLSWRLESGQRGEHQTAWQVLVATEREVLERDQGDLWDSGKVNEEANTHIHYKGADLQPSQQVFWKVRVWDRNGVASLWSPVASWTMGLWSAEQWDDASWIGAETETDSVLLHRELKVKDGLERALIHVSGLGHYELFLNGKKAGEDLLTPGWTNYAVSTLYDTRDVTDLLRRGDNELELILGNGMFHVERQGRFAKFENSFGKKRVIAHLRLEYADGTVDTVVTDGTWKVHRGPVTFTNMYGGEDHDARIVPVEWSPVEVRNDLTLATLRGHRSSSVAVRVQEVRQPVEVRKLAGPGAWLYDFGQNTSYMPRLTVKGPRGSRVRLIPGERIYPDGIVSRASMGGIHRGSSWWEYIKATDEEEIWFPQFFYIGSRYVQVQLFAGDGGGSGDPGYGGDGSGDPGYGESAGVLDGSGDPGYGEVVGVLDGSGDTGYGEIAGVLGGSGDPGYGEIVALEGCVVHADVEAVGHFAASNPLLNRIRELVRWAQRSNMVSVLTDCPHREKLGWLEQIHLNGPSLRYEFDLARLFSKAMQDMADSQTDEGLVPNIAPEMTEFRGTFRAAAEWGAAFIQVPWQQYQFNGDTELFRMHYPRMQAYFAYLQSRAEDDILSEGLGDWFDLGPRRPPGRAQLTQAPVTATAYYFNNAKVLAQVAALLGHDADARDYEEHARRIRQRFNEEFYNAESGSYAENSQTANAIPLVMGIVEEENRGRVFESLLNDLKQRDYSITTGGVGYRYLLQALTQHGRDDVIYHLITQEDKPGYAYQLKQGATALTESWEAHATTSNNHFMLGHITEWFYKDLAGIQVDAEKPGFRGVIIAPRPVGDLEWVEASYESLHGPVAVRWERKAEKFMLNVSVPPNVTSTVWVPAKEGEQVLVNGEPVESCLEAEFIRREGDRMLYATSSGEYSFVSVW